MKDIKQHKDSDIVLNLETCTKFYRTKNNFNDGKQFSIVFEFNNDSETWYYDTESEMEKHFETICNIKCVTCIGDVADVADVAV